MASGYRWRDIDHSTGFSNHHIAGLTNKKKSKNITNRASRHSQESNISYNTKYNISHFKHINNKIKHVLCERTILPHGSHKQAKRRKSTADAGLASSGSGGSSSANSSRNLSRSMGGGANEHARTPAVYKFKEIYERHRQQLLRQANAEARRMREFHSRPAPNFQRQHKRNESRSNSTIHSITIPITPLTLKKSMETQKKLERLREAHEHILLQKPKFNFHSTAYMTRQPFKPKHTETKIEVKPFKLCCGERALARQKFNEAANQALEKRYREQYMERMKQEIDEWLQLRKMTIFKANPNPWRRFYAQVED